MAINISNKIPDWDDDFIEKMSILSTQLWTALSGLHATDEALYDNFKGDVNYVLNGGRSLSGGVRPLG